MELHISHYHVHLFVQIFLCILVPLRFNIHALIRIPYCLANVVLEILRVRPLLSTAIAVSERTNAQNVYCEELALTIDFAIGRVELLEGERDHLQERVRELQTELTHGLLAADTVRPHAHQTQFCGAANHCASAGCQLHGRH